MHAVDHMSVPFSDNPNNGVVSCGWCFMFVSIYLFFVLVDTLVLSEAELLVFLIKVALLGLGHGNVPKNERPYAHTVQ